MVQLIEQKLTESQRETKKKWLEVLDRCKQPIEQVSDDSDDNSEFTLKALLKKPVAEFMQTPTPFG